ncbi:hypothetical protein L914_14459 [Phytophthora nicotianae]|uniref:Uncharacterized protein n=1 Tax=Phytophthora nicotianae TaxID=4792 RepID=W2MV77_PHYNI|nr:hypothetical protein L916_12456 [Phytophthora nicotianae]ETM39389.1 hypothetical protein L914_14459 [Phytophthora nicotianae]
MHKVILITLYELLYESSNQEPEQVRDITITLWCGRTWLPVVYTITQ